MNNFTWYNPTRIIFGKGTHREAGREVAAYSKRILLLYGGESLKAAGTYEAITESLAQAGVEYVELGGVRPNPRLSLVRQGIGLCRREGLDFILAAGGGSVIDSAKAIAAGVLYPGDVWDFYHTEKCPAQALPTGVVLTIPAAGSESSDGSVITREEENEKRSFCSPLLYPKFAILNPELCYTLPGRQIAAGGADILAHVMERYFSPNDSTELSDRLCEAAMRTILHYVPLAYRAPARYDVWAEIMWAGNMAHNGILGKGKKEDWASHNIEHELSAQYDIAHGAGLAIIFPAWMKYVSRRNPARFVRFAHEVFGIGTEDKEPEDIAALGICCLENFFRELELSTSLHKAGIDGSSFSLMAERAVSGGMLGSMVKLDREAVMEILELAK